MTFRIYNKELDAYRMEGDIAWKIYEEDFFQITNPNHWKYSDVLVRMKKVRTGIVFTFTIQNQYWRLRPLIEWRWGNRRLAWLWFDFVITNRYGYVIDKVVKDHVQEALNTIANA